MQTKTHWKKLTNPNYLGAYSLEPGQDMVVTIKSIKREIVVGAEGRKEECTVARFSEGCKPMILNKVNQKRISRLYKSPYIEDWVGKKIQLYSEMIKYAGELTEGLRVREFIPKVSESYKCSSCQSVLLDFGKMSAEKLAAYTSSKYGMILCAGCAKERAEAASGEADNLGDLEGFDEDNENQN